MFEMKPAKSHETRFRLSYSDDLFKCLPVNGQIYGLLVPDDEVNLISS